MTVVCSYVECDGIFEYNPTEGYSCLAENQLDIQESDVEG